MRLIAAFLLAGWTIVLCPPESFGAVTLPRVLSRHMVLQRDVPVPIWGTADPNETVTVTFRDQTKTATADAQGHWLIKLDALQVGDPTKPDTLTVKASNTITLDDILVGEVWVGSGQSNLETDVYDYTQFDSLLADAAKVPHPLIRIYRSDVGSGWQMTTPDTLHRFSAQFFYFGYKLQDALGVPVGLMEGAMRGSPSGPWISQQAFTNDPDVQAAAAAAEAHDPLAKRLEKYNAAMTKWQADLAAAKAAGTPDNKLPHEPHKPVAFNEQKTGDLYEKHIRPMIPYAMRGVLWDQGEGGTLVDPIWQPVVMKALIRAWRADWAQGDFPWLIVEKPSGEGAALDPTNPINKECSPISPLPKDPPGWQPGWPQRWDWLKIKDVQLNVFLVTASDLAQCPTPTNPHPRIKSGYAMRDCQVALGAVYGKPIEYYGPLYQGMTVEGDKIRLTFTHVGKGLTTPSSQPLQGFEIAGADKKYRWANATIDGETVVVSSPDVPTPASVRYAWAGYDITWANLFNVDGLPALTFQTEK